MSVALSIKDENVTSEVIRRSDFNAAVLCFEAENGLRDVKDLARTDSLLTRAIQQAQLGAGTELGRLRFQAV
jgi:hypothetical protein